MIHHGDSLEVLKSFESNSIDSLVTDPPYGLGKTTPENVRACLQAWLSNQDYQASGGGFMSKEWDSWCPSPNLWREVYRVLKPGAYGLVFSGSRTEDLMSMSLRLAGFEVRDRLVWLYGSGFPKSHNVSLSIDKRLGYPNRGRAIPTASKYQASDINETNKLTSNPVDAYEPATEQAKKYNGFGTALKPAYEPIILVRKPLEGTVADNVLKHGVGGLNIDDCRIPPNKGRWPSNILLDDKAAIELDKQSGIQKSGRAGKKSRAWGVSGNSQLSNWQANNSEGYNDKGGASRFFYCTKASKAEREAGLTGLIEKNSADLTGRKEGSAGLIMKRDDGKEKANPYAGTSGQRPRANVHPTVKPLDLMRYLCRLITPPDGTILEPFAGSGTTLCAAALEGFTSIGIERESEYIEIIKARLKHWSGGDYDYTPDETKAEPKAGEQLNLFK